MFKLCKREQGNEAGSGSREHRSSRDDHCVYDRSTSNYLNTKTRTKEVLGEIHTLCHSLIVECV